MTITVFTQDVDAGAEPVPHTLTLSRCQAVEVARTFYCGDVYTSVSPETLDAFTPEERARVETPRTD